MLHSCPDEDRCFCACRGRPGYTWCLPARARRGSASHRARGSVIAADAVHAVEGGLLHGANRGVYGPLVAGAFRHGVGVPFVAVPPPDSRGAHLSSMPNRVAQLSEPREPSIVIEQSTCVYVCINSIVMLSETFGGLIRNCRMTNNIITIVVSNIALTC